MRTNYIKSYISAACIFCMIKKKFKKFIDVYNELIKRNFDIVEIKESKLEGKIVCLSEALERQREVKVRIYGKRNNWVLEADDNFYLNESHYSLIANRRYLLNPSFAGISFSKSLSAREGISSEGGHYPLDYPPTKEDIDYVKRSLREELKIPKNKVYVQIFPEEIIALFSLQNIKMLNIERLKESPEKFYD